MVLLTIVPAVLVVITPNIVRAACWLLLSLSGAAGLFFFLGADFVGATQLLIYVGGTLVLVIFGVMLTATGPFVNLATRPGEWVFAILVGATLLGVLLVTVNSPVWQDKAFSAAKAEVGQPSPYANTTHRIGMAFLSMPLESPAPSSAAAAPVPPPTPTFAGYLLPFEIVSVHLVVVLIAAAYLARAKHRRRLAKES